jgi:hypothetical protein
VLSYLMLALLFLPSGAFAQGATNWENVRAVPVGDKLEVEFRNGKRQQGKLAEFSDAGLTLQIGKKTEAIPRDNVRKIHRLTGTPAGKTTLIGAASGAAGGALLGATSNGCSRNCFVGRGASTALGAVFGGGIGAIGGFLIGKAKHKRVLIFEAV